MADRELPLRFTLERRYRGRARARPRGDPSSARGMFRDDEVRLRGQRRQWPLQTTVLATGGPDAGTCVAPAGVAAQDLAAGRVELALEWGPARERTARGSKPASCPWPPEPSSAGLLHCDQHGVCYRPRPSRCAEQSSGAGPSARRCAPTCWYVSPGRRASAGDESGCLPCGPTRVDIQPRVGHGSRPAQYQVPRARPAPPYGPEGAREPLISANRRGTGAASVSASASAAGHA